MNDDDLLKIQDLENNDQLRKAIIKLKYELKKKENELMSASNLYKDLKLLNQKIKKESDDLNSKLNNVKEDMKLMEKKYQDEILSLKSHYEKQIEIYNNKILKFSENNQSEIHKYIKFEIEKKYKQQFLQEEQKIKELLNKLNICKEENEVLSIEYETYKSDVINEINIQKEFHQNEINSLIEKMNLEDNLELKQ